LKIDDNSGEPILFEPILGVLQGANQKERAQNRFKQPGPNLANLE